MFLKPVLTLHQLKKTLLKVTLNIYDPIGILSPIAVLLKILFKKISLSKYDRDVVLEPNLVSEPIKSYFIC